MTRLSLAHASAVQETKYREPLHYAKKEAFIFQIGLPAKASLEVKSAFSSTNIKICSLVCTRFHFLYSCDSYMVGIGWLKTGWSYRAINERGGSVTRVGGGIETDTISP